MLKKICAAPPVTVTGGVGPTRGPRARGRPSHADGVGRSGQPGGAPLHGWRLAPRARAPARGAALGRSDDEFGVAANAEDVGVLHERLTRALRHGAADQGGQAARCVVGHAQFMCLRQFRYFLGLHLVHVCLSCWCAVDVQRMTE